MMTFFIQLGTLAILYFVYIYLVKLNTCQCTDQQAVQNIKKVEEFYILVTSIAILSSFLQLIFPQVFTMLPKIFSKYMYYGVMIYFMFVVFVDIFLIYNVYQFGLKTPWECACASGWEKYYIFFQGFCVLFFFFIMIVGSYSLYTILPSLQRGLQKNLKKKKRR